jgi:hypothetical protein
VDYNNNNNNNRCRKRDQEEEEEAREETETRKLENKVKGKQRKEENGRQAQEIREEVCCVQVPPFLQGTEIQVSVTETRGGNKLAPQEGRKGRRRETLR